MRVRALVPAAAVVFVALLLVVPTASATPRIPTLASTPQYKAFAKNVNELRGLRNTAASATQKASYQATLSKRHSAAVAKSTALFQRSKRLAKAQVQGTYAASVREVREAEASELSDLRGEYRARMENTLRSFDKGIASVERFYDRAEARLQREIRALRKAKAKALSPFSKARIEIQLDALNKSLVDNREDETKARKRFRDRYTAEKRASQAVKAEESRRVQETDQSLLNRLQRQRERTYDLRVGNLQTRRETQLASLEDKFDAGRLSIAEMPVSEG